MMPRAVTTPGKFGGGRRPQWRDAIQVSSAAVRRADATRLGGAYRGAGLRAGGSSSRHGAGAWGRQGRRYRAGRCADAECRRRCTGRPRQHPRPRAPTSASAEQPQALAQSSADPAAAADELGRQGRFVEAMHMLLLLSLGEIRRHLGEQFADSLTSREILRGTRLPPQGRASLRDIVARVEWTYFGGYPATMEDYTACRQSFDTLRGILRGERPA